MRKLEAAVSLEERALAPNSDKFGRIARLQDGVICAICTRALCCQHRGTPRTVVSPVCLSAGLALGAM